MSKLVARHGLSRANDRRLYGTPAFGHPEAKLLPLGRKQARELGRLLVAEHGVDLAEEPVAVTRLYRTQETASVAGFRHIVIHSELDEEKGGLSDEELRLALDSRRPLKPPGI